MNVPSTPYPPMPPQQQPASHAPFGASPQGYPPFGYPPQGSKKKKKRAWIIVLVLLLAAIVVGCLLAFYMCDAESNRDRNADFGQLEGKSAAEIQQMLDQQVEEGMFNISIAGLVEFEDGTTPGNWEIENIPGNRYLMQVTVTRDDNGDVIYESGIIDPNYHVQRAPLKYDLPKGDYECTAVFSALDPESEEMVGQAGAKVLVRVKS